MRGVDCEAVVDYCEPRPQQSRSTRLEGKSSDILIKSYEEKSDGLEPAELQVMKLIMLKIYEDVGNFYE